MQPLPEAGMLSMQEVPNTLNPGSPDHSVPVQCTIGGGDPQLSSTHLTLPLGQSHSLLMMMTLL